MAAVCKPEFMGFVGLGTAAPAAVAAGVTWLVSSATTPLVGGVLGGVCSLTSMIAMAVLLASGVKKDDIALPFFAVEIGSAIAFALAASALGYSVSIPLALLLTLTNILSLFGSMGLIS